MRISSTSLSILIVLSLLFMLAACGPSDPPPEEPAVEAEPEPLSATAVLEPTEGNQAAGTVTFTETDGGVQVVARLTGVSEGEHGFHVHETGDCSAPDGTSAGGHYAPMGTPHGAPSDSARHMGDLGNITAGADSTATYDQVDPVLELDGPNSIVGKAVIVHAEADDLTSQPTGAAGARLACGVIEAN